uniref:Uncharacterized protein n=1 Tax=Hyaloperonospora arabidopsidis (strain Emoy2) TaxID=559515 RepID=M4BVT4_HYAAE
MTNILALLRVPSTDSTIAIKVIHIKPTSLIKSQYPFYGRAQTRSVEGATEGVLPRACCALSHQLWARTAQVRRERVFISLAAAVNHINHGNRLS